MPILGAKILYQKWLNIDFHFTRKLQEAQKKCCEKPGKNNVQ